MGEKYGFLISDHYVREVPGEVDMNTSSIFWGFSLGIAVFTASKAGKQSYKSWRRTRRITAYSFMIWAVWCSSMVLGILAWGFQRQYIQPSFGFFFNVALFWAFQIQFLLQIIINRIGLLMVVPGRATRLKWIVFFIILAINISVFIIWMPARLQINSTWIHLNEIWDRCEKAIFALVDGCLNFYFIYLTRTTLINNGLTKYTALFHANIVLVFVSLSLDVVLVGLMSLPSSLVYLSFHPVAYLLKLQIEMKMAELITKIVKSTGSKGSEDVYYNTYSTGDKSKPTGGVTGRAKSKGITNNSTFRGQNTTQIGVGDHDDVELGIRKTVETTVARSPVEEADEADRESRSSSTRNLHHHHVDEFRH